MRRSRCMCVRAGILVSIISFVVPFSFSQSLAAIGDSIVIVQIESPRYPLLAKFAGLQGTLTLIGKVDLEGQIVDIARESFNPLTKDRVTNVLWEYAERYLREKCRLRLLRSGEFTSGNIRIEITF